MSDGSSYKILENPDRLQLGSLLGTQTPVDAYLLNPTSTTRRTLLDHVLAELRWGASSIEDGRFNFELIRCCATIMGKSVVDILLALSSPE